MRITFVAATSPTPSGGALAVCEFANAMRRRGHDVHLVHRPATERPITRVDDITWCEFEPGIDHRILPDFDLGGLPDADFVFQYDDALPPRSGLPLIFVQGLGIGRAKQERRMRTTPCPKVCVARWLVDLGRRVGVPEEQLVHAPCGVRPDRFHLVTPIDGRPLQVAMLYHQHPMKGGPVGLAALERVRARVPDVHVVVFAASEPSEPMPPWVDLRVLPPHEELVGDVYNRTRVFLSPGGQEGFGLPALEAMACGAALVSADNGGAGEYAVDGETALVGPAGDPDALAERVVALLTDDATRRRLAAAGLARAAAMTWHASAERLEGFLERYAADPPRYQRVAEVTG